MGKTILTRTRAAAVLRTPQPGFLLMTEMITLARQRWHDIPVAASSIVQMGRALKAASSPEVQKRFAANRRVIPMKFRKIAAQKENCRGGSYCSRTIRPI
jgi:hypothetical protein